ncbi:hypothetical protein GOV06_05210 [Candidatus Woesearchaeota archaeon]|nr:hypothetical protein [Candidatus Woesearchaeota archaeon]
MVQRTTTIGAFPTINLERVCQDLAQKMDVPLTEYVPTRLRPDGCYVDKLLSTLKSEREPAGRCFAGDTGTIALAYMDLNTPTLQNENDEAFLVENKNYRVIVRRSNNHGYIKVFDRNFDRSLDQKDKKLKKALGCLREDDRWSSFYDDKEHAVKHGYSFWGFSEEFKGLKGFIECIFGYDNKKV